MNNKSIAVVPFATVLTILCFFVSGCKNNYGSDVVLTGTEPLISGTIYTLSYNNVDTLNKQDLSIFIVCKKYFTKHYRQLPLKVVCISPDSMIVEYNWRLIPQSAQISRTATQMEIKQKFVENALFFKKGIYKFDISLDSTTAVKGILGIGIDIVETTHGKR